AEKFLAERVGVWQRHPHNGMSGLLQGRDGVVLSLVGLGGEPQISKDSIVTVDRGFAKLFAVDRNDAFADFSSGFGDQLLEPGAEVGDAGRSDEGDLVAAVIRSDTKNRAKDHAGINVSCRRR